MIPYPLPLPTEDTNWKVAFEKPSDVTLVGSWPNKLSVKNKDGIPFGVDLAVEMPDVRSLIFIILPSSELPLDFVPRKRLSQRALLSQASVLRCNHRESS